jgi:dephospho-CoA kinase
MEIQARENPAVALLHERMEGGLALIGLTGGIACGKSTVSGILKEMGWPVIDADQIARDVVRPGSPAYDEIIAEFGNVLAADGTLDRERLGALVFENEERRLRLEAITHPYIFRAISEEVARLRRERNPKAVIVDAALLFESGLADCMDKTVVVTADEEIQLRRLMERDRLDEGAARRRIASQMTSAEKIERANLVIDNSGSLEETRGAVQALFATPSQ